jgi:Tol biopolymer transport system component
MGSRKLLTVPSPFPSSFSWSPDKQLLSFTLPERGPYFGSLWEMSADGSNLHQLLTGWNNKSSQECCGKWTPDGKYYIFISQQQPPAGRSDIWAIREQTGFFGRRRSEPVQLTNGPLSFESVTPSVDGKKLFARGSLFRGELMRYDANAGRFATYLSGISAEGVDFSRDGAWMTYVAYPEGTLWRSRVDGSERLQLSFPPMYVFMPRWSPDGKRIAFNAMLHGKSESKIYLISAEGGVAKQLFAEERSQVDLSWSPDGNFLVFGGVASALSEIDLLDLRTMEVSTLAGSQGLFSPRWSPDGHYVVALSQNYKKLMLYDFTTSKWAELAVASGFGFFYPSWSHDGKYIYAENVGSPGTEAAIIRVRLNDRKLEQTIALKDFTLVSGVKGGWSGLAPDDSVMVLRDIGSQELYALDWLAP